MKILNLCAGSNPVYGAVNTDIVKVYPNYVIWDLNNKSKFKDNTFDVIVAKQALNYIKPENFLKVMEELWRIAKPNARIVIFAVTTRSHKSMFIQPFKLHINDIECFFNNHYYHKEWALKANFKILNKSWNNILPRWATRVWYHLKVIKDTV